jgi:pimeloyl-ACP methyl ester carboxylesterase
VFAPAERRNVIAMATDTALPPVLLVHGWGGSYAETWERPGIVALLEDAGRQVIGVDLLGHGTAPKPHEPEAYADLGQRILDALPDTPVDAVGFSLGALTLLRVALDHPRRFRKLVLAGVGENVFLRDDVGTERIIAGLEGAAPPDDNIARLFVQYADQPGNDRVALAAVMRRPPRSVLTEDDLSAVACPTLVAIGDRDFAGPGDRLAGALPEATLVVLRNVDHFATPGSFAFIDAMLEFVDAVPA